VQAKETALLAAVGVQANQTACCLLRWGCWRRSLLAECCGGGAGQGDCLLAARCSEDAREGDCLLLAAMGLQAKGTAC
jgi:hypothetical protein